MAAFYGSYFGALGVILPFLGPFLVVRGLGAVGVGLATAGFSLAKLAYAPLLGAAVDRGRWARGLLTGHALLAAAATAGLGVLHDAWAIGLMLVAAGLGFGAILPLVEAAVLERLPGERYGPLRVWGSVGFVVVSLASGAAVGRWGLELFPLLATGALVAVLLASLGLEGPARPVAHERGGGRIPRATWLLLALLTVNQVAHGPYYAFFSIELERAGHAALTVSLLWSLGVVAELVAFAAGGRLQVRWGLRPLLAVGLLAGPVRWGLLALGPHLALVTIAQVGHGLTFALAHLAGIQLVQRGVPPDVSRRMQGLYSGLVFGAGIVVGTAAAGPLYAVLGGPGTFAAAAALAAAVALAWLLAGRRLTS